MAGLIGILAFGAALTPDWSWPRWTGGRGLRAGQARLGRRV